MFFDEIWMLISTVDLFCTDTSGFGVNTVGIAKGRTQLSLLCNEKDILFKIAFRTKESNERIIKINYIKQNNKACKQKVKQQYNARNSTI